MCLCVYTCVHACVCILYTVYIPIRLGVNVCVFYDYVGRCILNNIDSQMKNRNETQREDVN